MEPKVDVRLHFGTWTESCCRRLGERGPILPTCRCDVTQWRFGKFRYSSIFQVTVSVIVSRVLSSLSYLDFREFIPDYSWVRIPPRIHWTHMNSLTQATRKLQVWCSYAERRNTQVFLLYNGLPSASGMLGKVKDSIVTWIAWERQ